MEGLADEENRRFPESEMGRLLPKSPRVGLRKEASRKPHIGGPILLDIRWTPHPVIMTIRDASNYIRGPLLFLLYHYYRVGGPPKLDTMKPSGVQGGLQEVLGVLEGFLNKARAWKFIWVAVKELNLSYRYI